MSTKRAPLWQRQLTVLRIAGVGLKILIPPILLGLVLSAAYVGQAFSISAIFTELVGPRDMETIAYLIVVLAVFLIAIPLLGVAKAFLINRVGLILKRNLRRAILNDIDARGPMRLSSQRAGNLESLMVDGVEAIEPYYGSYLPQIVVTTITAAAICAWIATVSLLIAVVLFVCVVIIFLIPRLWDRVLAEKGQEHWTAYAELNSDFVDAMTGMTTLKAFGAAEHFGNQLAVKSRELLRSTLSQLRVSLGETGASATMMVLSPAIALLIGVLQVRAGMYPVTYLFFITLLSMEVFRPLRDLANAFHSGYFGLSAANQIYSTLDLDSSRPPAARNDLQALPADEAASIEVKDLGYRYDNAASDALHGVNLRIPQGKFVAIVGGSGSGKSTLLGLMLGFDAPHAGNVTVGGISAEHLDIVSTISLVPQNPVIFPGKIEEILNEANPNATTSDMLTALTIAHAANFRTESADSAQVRIASTKDLELVIDESAANISGGQKQRLAIARALVRKPRVLILDESTSALDSRVEKEIITMLRKQMPNMTLILVTHRMDVAQLADHVVVLGQGTICEQGNPIELLQHETEFARMVSNSSNGASRATAN